MKLLFNKGTVITLALLCLQLGIFAQNPGLNDSLDKAKEVSVTSSPKEFSSSKVEMADDLYQSGKIYVVITAIALIFVGIIIYLILLDRKIGKLEDELKKD